MRRLLGSVLAVLLLAGPLAACGDDEGSGTATDEPTATTDEPTATPSESPTKGGGTGDSVDFELVKMITETAAGGSTSETAVPLGDDDAVAQFTSQFENDAMTRQVQDAVEATDVADDERLYGAVVAIGCDAPTDVTVTSTDSGLVITALKVPTPQQECFAAMTTVSLVLVPASAVE
jgi:hypothetical protein